MLVFSPSAVFISIHAPPRGATGLRRNAPTEEANFNSRPSARGDSIPGRNSAAPIIFQFTPLREGRQDWMQKKGLTRYFNSRPSARGDDAGAAEPCFLDISIHAPPRGATGVYHMQNYNYKFQFTPLREGRPASRADLSADGIYFNSRPSARGDCPCFRPPPAASISIHAPPRGATRRERPSGHADNDFNSRPSARGDGRCRPAQSTTQHFNSRPSARGDRREMRKPHGGGISIHAPPRGATLHRYRSNR